MKKFWNFKEPKAAGLPRTLYLDGPIDDGAFWGDEVTPKQFRSELEGADGPLVVEINSPGGNVFAASDIYTMLKGYRNKVTMTVTGLAASAASVVAMAGDKVEMSPTGMMMIHDPSTLAWGNTKDMEKAISTLNEVKESIINAYEAKTGLARDKIGQLMEDETWMNARRAKEMGFIDSIIGEDEDGTDDSVIWSPYSDRATGMAVMAMLTKAAPADEAGDGSRPEDDDEEPEKDGLKGQDPGDEPDGPETDEPDDPEGDEPDDPDTDEPDEPERDGRPEDRGVVIGPDGKTADGSVPYAYLMKMLERAR